MKTNLNLTYFPIWMSKKIMLMYIALCVVLFAVFSEYSMEWYFSLISLILVVGFVFGVNYLTKTYHTSTLINEKKFENKLFWWSFVIRIIFVCFSYVFFNLMTGQPFEFAAADSLYYNQIGIAIADAIWEGMYNLYSFMVEQVGYEGVSDMGYPFFNGILYALSNNSMLFSRIVQSSLDAATCVLIYRIAHRNMNENIARMAGIFCACNPMTIFYCGLHLKEPVMTFLFIMYLNQTDKFIHEGKFSLKKILPIILLAFSLYFFRTVLAVVAILSLLVAILFTPGNIFSKKRKISICIGGSIIAALLMSNVIIDEIQTIVKTDIVGQQEVSMNVRYGGSDGNSFAKYASGVVFAPMIFTFPFPTMVYTPKQEDMRMIHAGLYIKNILSGFTIFALFILLFTGEWRKYTLCLAAMVGYLIVLVFSQFAHSIRFHIPVLPLEMLFAAYGLAHLTSKYKRVFNYWLILIFIAIIAWNWFKLAGRGLV